MSVKGKAAQQLQSVSAGRSSLASRVSLRFSSTLLLLLVFIVEVGVGVFLLRDLRTANIEAQRMYAGSVLGLRRIGELQYQSQETRRSTLYALTTADSNLQVEYADQTRAADHRVTEGIAKYLREADTSREIELGTRLQRDWSAYLKVRDEVLASILEGSTKEAVALDLSGGVPLFDRVRQDLEEIKRLYDEQASQGLATVESTSHASVFRLVGVIFFTLLFATGSVWAIQRSRMQSTLDFAKLQMDFVASVSHELRTPLSVICLAADNIADGLIGGKEQMDKYRSVIRNQSRQVTELVNQILLFASTQERPGQYVLYPLKVPDVIQSVIDITAALVKEAGFTIDQHVDPGLPEIMGDLQAISQCLQNLIVNAVKYGGDAHWIGIRATLGDAQQHGRKEVRISVQDRGLGISEEDVKRIFEPFYRSPAVTAAQIHGTGLGLPVAKSIVEAMGGKLSVDSELGVGSVFTLHLLAAKPKLHVADFTPEPKASSLK
jgi:signal transduction histidine kinase